MAMQSRKETGFTLIEVMIVVAIIAVLAAVAIPNFISYQARSRRSEAFLNLATLARAQQSYHAEEGEYFEAGSYPNPADQGTVLSADHMEWDEASQDEFAAIGWQPEGGVYYAYDVNTGASGGCSCSLCFTASAIGDVDADGDKSAVMYVHPEEAADGSVPESGQCSSGLYGFGTPVVPGTDKKLFKTVAVQRISDEF
jgi:type IV pilus assembly protein PilA